MYTAIFKEIVDIMHHDYAGFTDKKGLDSPEKYMNLVKALDAKEGDHVSRFEDIVQDYLLDFQDPHMSFNTLENEMRKKHDVGFAVRRYEDKLYVTTVGKADQFTIGDAIISMDEMPVPELVNRYKRELMQDIAEREDWKRILPRFGVCEVLRLNGKKEIVELQTYKKEYIPEYSMEHINDHTLYMKLTDFMDQDAVDRMLHHHEKSLNETPHLIIDVRVNYGGSDEAFGNILPYLFNEGTKTYPLYENYAMKANYTTRNCDLFIAEAQEMKKTTTDKKLLDMIPGYMKDLKEKKGKGFIEWGPSKYEEVTGTEYPKKVIVLSDVYCGSAGDFFVNACRYSPKTTIVGRPTAGLNDYSNLMKKTWHDQFELLYPLTRLNAIDYRGHKTDGIQPHIYIPWTPRHIEQDIDLKKAFELLSYTDDK